MQHQAAPRCEHLSRRLSTRRAPRAATRNEASDAAAAWLAARGDESSATLFPVANDDRIEIRRLTGDTVYRVGKKLGKEAGIKPFGRYDLRRSCLGEMLDRGVDLAIARAWAGHAASDRTSRPRLSHSPNLTPPIAASEG
ncbi:MAG: tyrosine-type recombinase/integrase [Planctomycetota bacterium]